MIRLAKPEDSNRLGEIHVAGWRTTYRGRVSDEYLFTKHLVVNSTRMFRTQIEADARIAVFLDDKTNILKGFLWVGDSRDSELMGYDEILAYYVQPEFKGQGVGTALMKSFLQLDGISSVLESRSDKQFLWVLKENSDSIRLYEKFGFKADGKEKTEPGWDNICEVRMQRIGT
jgi:GNAT superfamily N-acetyltransferase